MADVLCARQKNPAEVASDAAQISAKPPSTPRVAAQDHAQMPSRLMQSQNSKGSPMNNANPSEKYEIIELALQESVGGGMIPVDVCGISCHIFSMDVCYVDRCSVG
jgi:hypothetical protein